ncbi:MAG: HD domain-containing protein [Christensenellaceae bacterium]|nr:HD domain-containing protein [Christensenellaceae bacterium]
MITLKEVKKNSSIKTLVEAGNHYLDMLGYTDHGPRHLGYVSKVASYILKTLEYSDREAELAKIAGWVHDVGNAINRENHGSLGATLLFPILKEMEMPLEDAVAVITAVGNHEEQNGSVTDTISAALVIGDKSDAHKSRVRRKQPDLSDIHDRVNYSIQKNEVLVLKEERVIRQNLVMDDEISSVFEYCKIYTDRISMCQDAAEFLGCNFELFINERPVHRLSRHIKTTL